MAHSEEKTDWLGNRITVHYDDSGNKTGESREATDWIGNPIVEHTDRSGNKTGESRETTDWIGNPIVEHTDTSGNKTGESRETTDWIGTPIVEHTDTSGNKTGESRETTDWIGNKIVKTTGEASKHVIVGKSTSNKNASLSSSNDAEYSASGSSHFTDASSRKNYGGSPGLRIAAIIFCIITAAIIHASNPHFFSDFLKGLSLSQNLSGTTQQPSAKPSIEANETSYADNGATSALPLNGGKYPATRMRLLTRSEIVNWSYSQLRYAINEMYARHGADFRDKDIKKYFMSFDWYRPVPGKTYDQAEMEFSPIETQNVKLLGESRNWAKVGHSSEDFQPAPVLGSASTSAMPMPPMQKSMPNIRQVPDTSHLESGHIYKIPDLQKLIGDKFQNAWLYGDFVILSQNRGSAVLQSRAETLKFGLSVFVNGQRKLFLGRTIVNLNIQHDFSRLADRNLITFPMQSPLRMWAVNSDSRGFIIVNASY